MSLWKVGGVLHSPKGILFTLIQTHTAYSEGSVLLGFLIHRDLPEPRIHIESRIVSSPSVTLYCLTNVRQWVGVLDSQRVKLPEVTTEAE